MTSAHFTNLAALIEKELAHAQSHIDVAVAWFTDPRLGQLLVNKARAKVQVRVVIRGDGINFTPPGPGKMDWETLLDAGATLYVAAESAPLHHKFCVVDRRRVVSGSYNWTQAAHNNLENVLICDQPDVIDAFSAEFEATCGRGRVVTDVPALVASVPSVEGASSWGASSASMPLATMPTEAECEAREAAYMQLIHAAMGASYQKQYSTAEAIAKEAVQMLPTRIEGYEVLAGAHLSQNQYAQCLAVAQQGEELAVAPHLLQRVELWKATGLALLELARYREAVQVFDRCIAAAPDISAWHQNKCAALEAWGRKDARRKAATLGRLVASEEIRHPEDDLSLLRAYLAHGFLREHVAERRQDARAAKDVFDRLPREDQNLHDLDNINALLE